VILYDYNTHPVGFVRDLISRYGDGLQLQFSRYFYRPQAILDQRECFDVSANEITPAWVEHQVSSLRPGWELALNSKVKDERRRTHHIGMIDFVGRPAFSELSEHVRNMLGAHTLTMMSYYDSGRSFHGYVADLMEPGEWHRFLGRLLLMNVPDSSPIVDARWIGHRLLGGYSALRWSANSAQHRQLPTRVRSI